MRKQTLTRLFTVALLYVLFTTNNGCQKKVEPVAAWPVAAARKYFETTVAPNGEAAKTFGLSAGEGHPVWSDATTMHLATGDAVWVPVQYQRSFFIGTNFSREWLFDINQLQFLVVYMPDRLTMFSSPKTKLITYYPDSACVNAQVFSGILRKEGWDGGFISSYRKDKEGNVYKYSSTPLSSITQRITPSSQMLIHVCYTASGYNYDTNNPSNGYYWQQDLGCSETFVPDNGGAGGGEDALAGLAFPPGYNSSFGMFGAQRSFSVRTGNNIISDIKDYNRCFDNIAGTKSYTVTVCVDQPKPGNRQPWGLTGTSSSASGNPVSVGHTFLIFSESGFNGTVIRNIGFYPKSTVNPIQPTTQGQLSNDANHDYNISLTINLTNSEFFQMMNVVNHANDAGNNYDLNSNNCTNFALKVLMAAGISLPVSKGSWLNGEGFNPGDLGEDVRGMQLAPNMSRNTTFNDHPNVGNCF